MEQINDPSAAFYPILKVVHGIVKVYVEPDSNSSYLRVPQETRLVVTETRPSRNSSAIMAFVEGEYYDNHDEYHTVEGWVSLNSNHLAII